MKRNLNCLEVIQRKKQKSKMAKGLKSMPCAVHPVKNMLSDFETSEHIYLQHFSSNKSGGGDNTSEAELGSKSQRQI